MPKINLYKIPIEKKEDLIKKFEEIELTLLKSVKNSGYILSFYYSKNIDKTCTPVWWAKMYKDFLNDESPNNKSPFACLLIQKDNILYANSLGKTHFYLNNFCDYNFGIEISTRIIDESSTDMKNSRLFGGNEKSSITSYIANTKIDYDSAESIYFLKGKSINKKLYGKKIQCGTSLCLCIKDFTPYDFPFLINNIEKELTKKPLFEIPTSKKITDKNIISQLDKNLIKLIKEEKTFVSINETQLSGVDFIFHKDDKLKFIYKRKCYELDDNTSIISIKDFLNDYHIDFDLNVINKSIIQVTTNTDRKYNKPFKYFIDYVDENRNFLKDGYWHQLNQIYIDILHKKINQIPLEIKDDSYNYYEKDFIIFKEKNTEEYWYAEKYFNHIQSFEKGFANLDRTRTDFDSYHIEISDLYKDETLYIVKIGKPQKLNYAIDQANTTLKYLTEHEKKVTLSNGNEVNPKSLVLWFILERKPIEKLTDIKSIIFLMKLSNWSKNVRKHELDPKIWISYKK